MKKEIELLEKTLSDLKKQYEAQEQLDYESSAHKPFETGDIVRKGDVVGIVGWTENNAINCPNHTGYMGVNIITGSRGFISKARRNEWEIVNDPYFYTSFEIKTELTGMEIEDLLYCIGPVNCNPNDTKTKLINLLKSIKINAQ